MRKIFFFIVLCAAGLRITFATVCLSEENDVEKSVTCKGDIDDKPVLMFCKYEIEETGIVERSCIKKTDKMIVLLGKHGRNDGGCIKKIEVGNRTETKCYCVGNNITACNGKCVATDCKVFQKAGESEKHQHCKASCGDKKDGEKGGSPNGNDDKKDGEKGGSPNGNHVTKDGEKGGSPNGNHATKDGENGGSPNGNQVGKGSTLIIIAFFLVNYVVV